MARELPAIVGRLLLLAVHARVLGELPYMSWLPDLRRPTSESEKTWIIVLCVVVTCALSIALVWQAQIIAQQRDTIRWLNSTKFSLQSGR